jgi:hypothetical protein
VSREERERMSGPGNGVQDPEAGKPLIYVENGTEEETRQAGLRQNR